MTQTHRVSALLGQQEAITLKSSAKRATTADCVADDAVSSELLSDEVGLMADCSSELGIG